MGSIADRVCDQFVHPYTFPSFHTRILEPYNYYNFGQVCGGSVYLGRPADPTCADSLHAEYHGLCLRLTICQAQGGTLKRVCMVDGMCCLQRMSVLMECGGVPEASLIFKSVHGCAELRAQPHRLQEFGGGRPGQLRQDLTSARRRGQCHPAGQSPDRGRSRHAGFTTSAPSTPLAPPQMLPCRDPGSRGARRTP